jgi:hypothetical protein
MYTLSSSLEPCPVCLAGGLPQVNTRREYVCVHLAAVPCRARAERTGRCSTLRAEASIEPAVTASQGKSIRRSLVTVTKVHSILPGRRRRPARRYLSVQAGGGRRDHGKACRCRSSTHRSWVSLDADARVGFPWRSSTAAASAAGRAVHGRRTRRSNRERFRTERGPRGDTTAARQVAAGR